MDQSKLIKDLLRCAEDCDSEDRIDLTEPRDLMRTAASLLQGQSTSPVEAIELAIRRAAEKVKGNCASFEAMLIVVATEINLLLRERKQS